MGSLELINLLQNSFVCVKVFLIRFGPIDLLLK